jgi:uncharacterized membrane protein HdeD (DUF308 family)
MELDRFKTAWLQQPLEGAAARPLEDIMRDVRRRAARFNRQIWQRDLLETLAGLVVIVAFGSFAWSVPQTSAKIGAVVVVAGCVGVMTRLHMARNRHPASPEMSAREFCAVQLKRLEDQISLLSTVAWWYIAPLLGGAAIFVLGADGPTGAAAATLGLFLAIGVLIYWLNRRAVRRHLQPMRDDLARILQDMAPKEG